MIRCWISTCALGVSVATAEPVVSGHAAVEWLAESAAARGGQTLRTAVRMSIEPPWHTYWVNPGEGGMPTGFSWKLPDGWRVSSVHHPLPKRFLTGELVGFGHEGTVWFPVEISVPGDFSGEVELQGTMTWLACNDEACVPGEAVIKLRITEGAQQRAAHTGEIVREFEKRPQPAGASARLTVEASEDHLVLRIAGDLPLDPTAATVFAVTPDIVDPTAEMAFRKTDPGWEAKVAPSPFWKDKPSGLEILIVPRSGQRAVTLRQETGAQP